MAVELGVGYITLVPSAKGITASIEQQLGGPLVAAGRKSGDATSAAFAGTFKKGLSGIQKGLLGTIGVAGIGVGLVKVGENFENAFNTIARGTGATGKELEGLDKSFKTVLKNGSGSFDQVSQAITKLNQRTGLTGQALEDFAAKEVTLARITKTDVAANLESTTGLFNLYGIAAGAQSDKLDVLFKASQLAGVSITQLADEMKAAAPTAKILGFSIDKTAAFVAQLDRAGLPAGKVMQGLAGAFSKAAKDGKAPLDVIHELVEEVKRAPTPTAAATIAIQKYGIGAKQAATLVAGLRSGAIDLNKSLDSKDAIQKAAAATQTLTGQLLHLKNEALIGLQPLATDALGALTRGLELALPLVTALTDHMNILGPVILTAAGAFAAFKIASGVRSAITSTVDALTKLRNAVFVSTAATADSVAASSASAAAKVADAAAASAQAVELRQLAQATLAGATADAAAASEGLASSAAAASAATAEAVALRAKATAALQAATAGGVVNKEALATATALGAEATVAEATAAVLRDKAAAELAAATATNPAAAGAAASAFGAEATAAEATAVALRAKATAAALAAQGSGFVGLSSQGTATALAAEAASAEATAVALRAKAVAEFQAASASGVVDLSALSAATALGVEASAAEAAAVAMQAEAIAASEAAVATRGLALTPIGVLALAAAAAITILTVKTKLFSHGQKDAGKETNNLIASLLDEGKALEDVAGQVLVKAIRDNKSLADTFKTLKVPLTTVNDALLGNKKAILSVAQAGAIGVQTGKISLNQYRELAGFIEKNSKSLQDQSDAKDRAESASKNLAGAETAGGTAAKSAAVAQDQLRIAATNLTTAIINGVDRLRGLQEGLVGVLQSAISLRQGLADIRDKQTAYNKAVEEFGPKSREAASALRDLEAAQLGQIGNTKAAVDGAVKQADAQSHLTDHLKTQADAQAALAKANSDLAHGKGSAEAVAKAQDDLDRATKSVGNSQKIQIEVLTALANRVSGPLHVALLQYLHDITVVPDKKETKIETPGLDAAFTRTHNYRGEMDKLPALKATSITLNAGQAFTTLAEFRSLVNSIPNNVSFKQAIAFEGGRLAKGGRAQPGRDYLVGERGTELLRMYASGGAYVFSNPELKRKGIPELADGGVFKKPTIAVVGESAQTTPEIVSPVRLMAETFKSVLKTTLSTSVVNTHTAKTQITADAVDAVRTVRGYVVELAKMPKTVTTKIAADTKPAAAGFADLAGAVSVSDVPFQKVSSQINEIGRSTETVEKRFKKSARTIREVVNTSADLRTKEPASGGLLAAPRRPDVTPLVIPSRITPPALPKLPKPDPVVIAAKFAPPPPFVPPKVAPVVIGSSVRPPAAPVLPKIGPLTVSARIATPAAPTVPHVRPLLIATRVAPIVAPSLPHVDPLVVSARFAKVVPPVLPKIAPVVVPTRLATPKQLQSIKPVAGAPHATLTQPVSTATESAKTQPFLKPTRTIHVVAQTLSVAGGSGGGKPKPPTLAKDNAAQFTELGGQVDATVAAGIDKFAPLVAAATARLGQTIVSNLSTSGTGGSATPVGATTTTTPLAAAGGAPGGGSGGPGTGETAGQRFGEWIARLKQIIPQRSGESINEWKRRIQALLAQRSGESISEWHRRLQELVGGTNAAPKIASGLSGAARNAAPKSDFHEFIDRVLKVVPQRSGESINEWKKRIREVLTQRSGESLSEWKQRIREVLTETAGSSKTAAGVSSTARLGAFVRQPPVPSTPAQSGKFALQAPTPAVPVVAPAAQLTPTFKTELQRGDTRSFVGVAKQEIHVDRQSLIEEINVANRKLGMRVAIAGRR